MQPKLINTKKDFIGRKDEQAFFDRIAEQDQAQILIVYGRRRVGKTELIEQYYRDRNILKFEGIENASELKQMCEVMRQLSEYTEQPLLAKISPNTWQEVLQYIANTVSTGTWTVYLEEVQWLSNYKSDFTAALKYVWDNYFRHNKKLLLILCGSSPSFMIKKIVHSKALYNRSTHEMALVKLDLIETQLFLKKHSQREIMDAYLTVGGIPEYLNWLKGNSSIFLSLCQSAFKKNSLFVREFEKIFVSSFSDNPYYKKIIEFLAKRRFASRSEIAKHLKISSGGSLSKILDDLTLCEFIQKYTPYNLKEDSSLVRFCIQDEYLHFYFRFIRPILSKIQNGEFNKEPTRALAMAHYHQWLGYAFERFCRLHYRFIAKALEFSGIDYKAGAYFNRATAKDDPGYQIDLLFERKDKVYTVCEVKYLQTKVNTSVIDEYERKLRLFQNDKQYTIQRVLICNTEPEQALINRAYFDRILTFKEIFDEKNWT